MAYDVEAIRRDFPLLNDWTYLNTGTVGLLPEPVLASHLEHIAEYERGGHTAEPAARAGYERARERLAALLGVESTDIALNRNATDGINTVVAGFPLTAGDEVITSTEEHPAMIIPLIAACERAGATLKFMGVSPDPDTYAEMAREAITPRTKLIAVSHVSCETGARVPVGLLRELAPDGTRILIDASQSVGQFEVHFSDLNADFVIGNGHKWLCGPTGTGFVWISPEALEDAVPVHFASDVVDPGWSRAYYQQATVPELVLNPSARRFEFGTRAWHNYPALAEAIDYLETLGIDEIGKHVEQISDYLRAQLSENPRVSLHSPDSWEESCGIVTFGFQGWNGVELSQYLWNEERIAQRRVEAPTSVRISCAFFTNTGDIDRLIDALEQVPLESPGA